MDRQAIIDRIKIVLDEFTPLDEGVTHPIDSFIDTTLVDAVRTLLKDYPIDKLWHSNMVPDTVLTKDNYLQILLKLEVVRVASVKLNSWGRLIHEREFLLTDNVKAAWQNNSITKASTVRPLVFKHQRKIGNSVRLVLDCHGTKTDSAPEELNVVVNCLPEELNDDLIQPLVYLTASLIFLHLGRPESAKPVFDLYIKYSIV